MHEPLITVIGNVGVVPTLRTVANGASVAGFRIASTRRQQDRQTGEWSDGETLWFGVTCWRTLAQHCAQSLRKGDRVVVHGRLVARSWRTDRGEERTGMEIDAVTVGYDLTRTAAAPLRPAGCDRDEERGAPSLADACPGDLPQGEPPHGESPHGEPPHGEPPHGEPPHGEALRGAA